MAALLGAIADDFTGATDLAGMLVKHGMRTVQMFGVPRTLPPARRRETLFCSALPATLTFTLSMEITTA